MKKIYLLGFAALAFTAATAQTTMKLAGHKRAAVEGVASKNGSGNSVNAVTGSISCTTFYTAGTSMTLNFTLTPTNSDGEYIDSLSITFPAGITPVTSSSNPFAPITDNGTGQTPEALNGVVGQTITWGDNDNSYGGIETLGNTGGVTSYNFSVDVTIGAGVTGTQMANFFASGDTYGAAPSDLSGTITINPVGATIVDLYAKLGGVQGLSYCNNTMIPIGLRIVNNGTSAVSNFPVSFKIDANAPVTETVTVTVAPGDSTDYIFTAMGDFTAEADYAVKVYTDIAGESNHGNDTLSSVWTNTVSVPLTSTPYFNGVETAADLVGLRIAANVGSVANWGLSTGTFHSGARALFLTGATAIADSWLLLKCMDVVNAETYNVSYWTRTNTGFNGGISISYGTTQSAAGMTTSIKPLVNNTANSTWVRDSANFTATSSGTIYIGIRGQGTAAGSGTNVRLDDINIHKVVPVGISKVVNNNDIILYPNPTSGLINLTVANANSQVEIFSVIGERVYSKSQLNKGNNMLDLSNVAEGTYIVRILSNGEVATKRITISK